jgi:hypothetical protein
MRHKLRSVVLAALLLALAQGRLEATESYGAQAGWGLAAAGTNLFYIPAKLAYATMGLVAGGITYAMTLGNSRAVEAIWSPAFGGTYVVTPAMLRGEEPILFFGETIEDD